MASNVRPLWHFSAPSTTLAIFWWCHSNVSQKTVATKKKLLQCYLAPWHCQTTWKVLGNCLQRMEGRGRGSHPPSAFLTFIWPLWEQFLSLENFNLSLKLQSAMAGFTDTSSCSWEEDRLWCLLCSLQGTPGHTLVAHRAPCYVPGCLEECRAYFL